jgi:hypothetical protein
MVRAGHAETYVKPDARRFLDCPLEPVLGPTEGRTRETGNDDTPL